MAESYPLFWGVLATTVALHAGPALAETSTAAVTQADLASLAARLDAERARLEAELRALEAEHRALLEPAALPEGLPDDPALRFYGFLEAGVQRSFMRKSAFLYGLQQTPGWTFILGNLHLYLDVTPAPRWRALVELRVSTMSGGYGIGDGGVALLGSNVRNFNEPGVGIGGYQLISAIVLERAQIEWSANDAFGLRVGLWLTPWGIWNVDHGSPTLIPLVQPYFQAFQMFPTHQLGLAAFGTLHALPWSVRYHLAVSNGRLTGPAQISPASWPTYDFDDDKMVSGRVSVHRPGAVALAAGLGGFWGRSRIPGRTVESVAPVRLGYEDHLILDEWGLGADLSLDVEPFRVRAEATYAQYRFPGPRPLLPLNATALHPDSAQWGGYLLAGYWTFIGDLRLEPYVALDVIWWPVSLSPLELGLFPSAGINLDIDAAVRLKLQYSYQAYFDVTEGRLARSTVDDVHALSARVVVSF